MHYRSIDILKLVLSFLVICIHARFQGNLGLYCLVLSRFAVPAFFIITGFFFEARYPRLNPGKTAHRYIHLIIISIVLHFVWAVYYHCLYLKEYSFSSLCMSILGGTQWGESLFAFLAYHELSPLLSVGHLWYLNASLYAWLIMYACRRTWGNRGRAFLCFLTPFLLLYAVIHSNYSVILLERYIYIPHIRNYLFCGLPYMCIGSWLYTKRDTLSACFSLRFLLACIIMFSLATCIEEMALQTVRQYVNYDYYLHTPLLAVSVFLFFLKLEPYVPKSKLLTCLAYFGKHYSSSIYLYHCLVILISKHLLSRSRYNLLYKTYNVEPILIFFSTLLVCIMLRGAKTLISRFVARR